jgi:hypothetical protein
MPRGPKGEKRPADVIGAAIIVAKIATGEIEETIPDDGKDSAAKALARAVSEERKCPKRIRETLTVLRRGRPVFMGSARRRRASAVSVRSSGLQRLEKSLRKNSAYSELRSSRA